MPPPCTKAAPNPTSHTDVVAPSPSYDKTKIPIDLSPNPRVYLSVLLNKISVTSGCVKASRPLDFRETTPSHLQPDLSSLPSRPRLLRHSFLRVLYYRGLTLVGSSYVPSRLPSTLLSGVAGPPRCGRPVDLSSIGPRGLLPPASRVAPHVSLGARSVATGRGDLSVRPDPRPGSRSSQRLTWDPRPLLLHLVWVGTGTPERRSIPSTSKLSTRGTPTRSTTPVSPSTSGP